MKADILNKINSNILSLTDEDYKIITEEVELKEALIDKIAEGNTFNAEAFSSYFEDEILNPKVIILYLNYLKENNVDEFINFVTYDFNSPSVAEEIGNTESTNSLSEYQATNLDTIINLIIANKDSLYNEISSPQIISRLMALQQFDLAYLFAPTTLTPDIENFIIESLNYNIPPYLNTISEKIFSACQNINHLELIINRINESDTKYIEEIKESLKNGSLDISVFNATNQVMKQIINDDSEINFMHLKNKIINKYTLYQSELEEIFSNEKLLTILLDVIEKSYIAGEKYHSYYNIEHPKVTALALKHDFSFISKVLKDENLLKTYQSQENFKENIMFNINNNLSELLNLVTSINFSKIPEDIALPILSLLGINDLLTLIQNFRLSEENRNHLITLIDKTLTAYPKSAANLPKNFEFKKDLPPAIMRSIIPVLNFETLCPENIQLKNYVDNVDILEAIFIRLKELKSNRYNNHIYEIQDIDSPTIKEIIFDPTNPLNLNITQILLISGKIKTDNLNYINTILSNSESISIQDIYTLVNKLNATQDRAYLNLIKRALPLVDNKKTLYQQIADFFKNQNNNYVTNQDKAKSEINSTLASIYEDFIKTQQKVPLSVTQYMSAETLKISSLDCLNDSLIDIEYFQFDNTRNLDTIIQFLTNSLDKGTIVNIEILYNIYKKNTKLDPKYYNYPNVSLDSNLLTTIISSLIKSPANKDLISRFIKTSDINKVLNISPNLYVPAYTSELIERLKISSSDKDLKIKASLLYLLDNQNVNEKEKQEIMNIINQAISNNHVDDSIPTDSNLFTSSNEYIINFIKRTIYNNCNNIQKLNISQKNIFSNQIYIDYFIELIEQNNLTLNYYFIDNICLENPPFKAELIKLINENRVEFVEYINVTNSYFDNDIYKAIMEQENIAIEVKKAIIVQLIHELAGENSKIIANISEYNTELTIDIICRIYNIQNKNNLKKVVHEYGLACITLIENKDFIALLNSDEVSVTRFFEIFKNREISMSAVEGIIDSLKQNLFAKDNANVIEFYTNSIAAIQRGISNEEEQAIVNTLINYIPKNLENIISKTEDEQLLNLYHTDYNLFMKYLLQALALNQNKYESIYHEITNNYIHQKRNEYRQNNNIYEDSKITYRYEEKSLLNAIINYYLYEFNQVPGLMSKLFDNNELNTRTVYFLTHPEEANRQYTKEEIISIKKNIKNVKSALEKYIKEKFHLDTYTGELNINDKDHTNLITLLNNKEFKPFLEKVKLIPVIPKNKQNLQELTKDLDYKLLRETILNNSDKFNCLIDILNKYSFLNWKDLFSPTLSRLTIGEDGNEMINFINAFSKIYDYEYSTALQKRTEYLNNETEKMRNNGADEDTINEFIKEVKNKELKLSISPYKIFNYCVIYSSIASCYKIMLGLEDFELVKTDKGPNASHGTRQERLDEVVNLQLQIMKIKEVSIPSFVHEYNFDDNRKLNIIVGNKSDSRNLTHGERTGACMRSYGHAHDLFKFCATDKRGFHLTIIDPETNEYISRVSGFRNGNTVFLNQLRCSLNIEKYSDEDLIEACKDVARRIIQESHNNEQELPIENVVVSTGYAVSNHYNETQQLSELDIGRGVYEGYKDVTNNAYVLATTNPNGNPVTLKLSPNQPSYKPVRLPIRTYKENEIDTKVKILMQRVKAIKSCLSNPDPNFYNCIDIDLDQLEHEYIYAIIGEDWYVALNSNLEIEKEQIEVDERSYDEIAEAITRIEQLKQTLGGNKYGK